MSVHRIARAAARNNGLRIYLDRPKRSVDDHHCILVPWGWTERLAKASDEERAAFTLEGACRVRWDAIGEELHIDYLVAEALAPYDPMQHQPYFAPPEDVRA